MTKGMPEHGGHRLRHGLLGTDPGAAWECAQLADEMERMDERISRRRHGSHASRHCVWSIGGAPAWCPVINDQRQTIHFT